MASAYGDFVLWLAPAAILPIAIATIHLLALFPSGRLLSDPWKPVMWLAIGGIVFYWIERVLTPGPLFTTGARAPTNPFAVTWVPSILGRGAAGLVIFLICTVLALGSLVYRLRNARGVERQQLKWFLFGAAWLWLVPLRPLAVAVGVPNDSAQLQTVIPTLASFAILLQPLTMGIGILQYRLFDIDIVINRTLVYGVVTALLAGAFAGLSVVAQRLALAITGQESQAAVVVAALVVTAFFQPLRSRVQTLVDRRFYRARYDASRTLERFTGQVRDEVNLGQLRSALIAIARDAACTRIAVAPPIGSRSHAAREMR